MISSTLFLSIQQLQILQWKNITCKHLIYSNKQSVQKKERITTINLRVYANVVNERYDTNFDVIIK